MRSLDEGYSKRRKRWNKAWDTREPGVQKYTEIIRFQTDPIGPIPSKSL
jgi:hypothetical protein